MGSPFEELLRSAKVNSKVFWDEDDWDRLADLAWKEKATSTDGLARIANRVQKQFPPSRQRPGILTIGTLKPLVKRIRAKERETRELAENAGRLAAQVTFYQDLPKTKEEILASLSEDEVRQHFFGRFILLLTVDDILSTFSPDQLVGSLATADLAAVLARRLVETLERPIEVNIQMDGQMPAKAPATQPNHRPLPPNQKRKKIVVIGNKGDEGRHVMDKVGDICDLSFMQSKDVREANVPKNADLVILWSRHVSAATRLTVNQVLKSGKMFEHHFGVKELATKIKHFCSRELTLAKAR